ncbi:hypothetical protein D049_4066A, partial [Vibrio parahaemolyticus VPTS-2010]
MFLIKL